MAQFRYVILQGVTYFECGKTITTWGLLVLAKRAPSYCYHIMLKIHHTLQNYVLPVSWWHNSRVCHKFKYICRCGVRKFTDVVSFQNSLMKGALVT